jgi:MFS family permease
VKLIEHSPRRPLLVYFLLASGIIAILFGLANKVWYLIGLRALLGGCENLSLIANIIVGELADDNDKPQGY